MQAHTNGQVEQYILGILEMEKGMDRVFGDLDKRTMILMKVNTKMITKMDMEFINGQTVHFIKEILKMI